MKQIIGRPFHLRPEFPDIINGILEQPGVPAKAGEIKTSRIQSISRNFDGTFELRTANSVYKLVCDTPIVIDAYKYNLLTIVKGKYFNVVDKSGRQYIGPRIIHVISHPNGVTEVVTESGVNYKIITGA